MSKDLQEKCESHRALSKYFCLHFLIDLIFILQNIYFCPGCLSRSYEIWIQTTFFALTTMQKDSDRQFQARQKVGRIDMVILLNIRRMCGICRCCETNYESCVIVFYATSSFRMCMFQIFARKSVQFRMWTKSIILN